MTLRSELAARGSGPSGPALPLDTAGASAELKQLPNWGARVSGAPPKPSALVPAGRGFNGPDRDLLDVAFSARNGERAWALWDANHAHASFSEALLGLARLLAFYTGPDEERLERLLLASPLFARSERERGKWHSPRPGGTWGRVYVVRKAIGSCRVFYSGPRGVGHNAYTLSASDADPRDAAGGSRQGRRPCPVRRAWEEVQAGDLPP